MQRKFPIRSWYLAALCGVLCLAGEAIAADPTPPKPAKSATTSSTKTTAHKSKHSRTKGKTRTSKKRGQKAIEAERTQQIQEALIREHYLKGEPSGKWDDATQAALRRYQAEQGWQSKTVPDSRALIKLGLGPNHDHLLNPESAMTAAPAPANRPARPASSNPASIHPAAQPTSASDPAPAPQ
jgi:peptidoglycan hydrolase-like protein with peptidoglycan-binding domain